LSDSQSLADAAECQLSMRARVFHWRNTYGANDGQHDNISRAIFAGAALALLLTGCERTDRPAITASTERLVIADATPIPQANPRDPSLPDAATALAQDDAEKAKAADASTAAPLVATSPESPNKEIDATGQLKPAPQEPITKAEEKTVMPLPSQANDHSTTALDRNTEK
jgi:hypothetical protein